MELLKTKYSKNKSICYLDKILLKCKKIIYNGGRVC